MLMVLEPECLDLSEAIEQFSEKQELLATVIESKNKNCLQKDAAENCRSRSSRSWSWRSVGAVGTQAQVGEIGEGKGSSQDVTRERALRS